MQYTPKGVLPNQQLADWVYQELLTIGALLSSMQTPHVNLVPLHAEPTKPRMGMVVYADGSDWDPGSGEGLYEYTTTWVKL